MSPKKMKVREEKVEEKEEDDDEEVEDEEESQDEEAEEDKQITDEDSEEQSDIEERKGPKKKKVREKEAEEEEEVEDDKVEDEVQEDKQVTDEESEEESESEEKGKKNGFMAVSNLAEPKMKRAREKEEEDKLTEEESDEESETEEKIKKGPKKIKIEKQTEKKIRNKKYSPHLPLDGDDDDDDDDDDCDDDMELKYDSDGSLIDDGECGEVTEPSKCQLSPKEKLKLGNLFIQLKHIVLPQHKIEKTAGTRALTKKEKAEFEKYAELRTGKYLPYENKKLRRNWKDFCIANEWSVNNPRPFLQMRYKNKVAFIDFKERMKFIQFLANGLDNRSLYSVFNRFKVLYDPHKVSRYSSSEDDIIVEYIRRYKLSDRERDRKFAELSRILKRTRASVWRRYRVLKRKRKILDDS